MSLTTDGLALGAAFAVAAGSAIQASQAFTELNAKTPLTKSFIPLLLAALGTLFSVVLSGTTAAVMAVSLAGAGLLAVPTELTAGQAAALTPGQAAALAPGQAAALTPEQIATIAAGQAAALTPEQIAALTAGQVKDLKKWLGWFLGWFFIMIGAFVALAGTLVMLVNDL